MTTGPMTPDGDDRAVRYRGGAGDGDDRPGEGGVVREGHV